MYQYEECKTCKENKEREGRIGLKVHTAVTVLVSGLLATINLTVMPEFLWFVFPLAGMSFGLLLHYFLAKMDSRHTI